MINTFVHSHSYLSKQNRGKTILWSSTYPYGLHKGVPPPHPRSSIPIQSLLCLKRGDDCYITRMGDECNRLHMYLDPYVPVGVVPKKWPFEVEQPVFLSLSGYNEPKLPTIPLISWGFHNLLFRMQKYQLLKFGMCRKQNFKIVFRFNSDTLSILNFYCGFISVQKVFGNVSV